MRRRLLITGILILVFFQIASAETKMCDFCRRIITGGDYIEAEGKYFHPEHFLCDYCNRPMGHRYVTHEGRRYHPACYENHIALRCAVCGEPINGEYYIDFWGNSVHKSHEGQISRCDYCGRFICQKITGGGVEYTDGRTVCSLCRRSAIDDRDEAIQLMTEIRRQLESTGIVIRQNKIPLSLVGRQEMARQKNKAESDPLGFTRYEKSSLAGGLITREDFEIFMLHGLPRAQFLSTLTHELMHVWLYENAALNLDPALTEGSCNMAAYLLLKDSTETDFRYVLTAMEDDPDPIYGAGFRQVMTILRQDGIDGWLDRLKIQKSASH